MPLFPYRLRARNWRLCHCQPRSFSELWNLNTDNGTCWLSFRRAGESGPQPTLGYANPSAVWSWNLISINWNVSLSLAFLFHYFLLFAFALPSDGCVSHMRGPVALWVMTTSCDSQLDSPFPHWTILTSFSMSLWGTQGSVPVQTCAYIKLLRVKWKQFVE